MPLVPVTGSRMNAAIVCGPSSWITSSRSRERLADGRPIRAGRRDTGRARGRRRACRARRPSGADRRSASCCRRWRRDTSGSARGSCGGRCTIRASLIAFSLASAPPLVKKKTSMSPGAIAASFCAEPRARLGRHERVRVRERRRLFLDRLDDALVAVADVHAHQLAVEVEVALAFGRPEVAALRAARPGSDRPSPARTIRRACAVFDERDHLFAGHRFGKG